MINKLKIFSLPLMLALGFSQCCGPDEKLGDIPLSDHARQYFPYNDMPVKFINQDSSIQPVRVFNLEKSFDRLAPGNTLCAALFSQQVDYYDVEYKEIKYSNNDTTFTIDIIVSTDILRTDDLFNQDIIVPADSFAIYDYLKVNFDIKSEQFHSSELILEMRRNMIPELYDYLFADYDIIDTIIGGIQYTDLYRLRNGNKFVLYDRILGLIYISLANQKSWSLVI